MTAGQKQVRRSVRRAPRAVTIAGVVVLVGVTVALLAFAPALVPVAVIATAAFVLLSEGANDRGLEVEEMDHLRRAEVALAAAVSTEAAARELAEGALALLGARAAVVLIEGVGDTVRVGAGEADREPHLVYEPGSRMRLLDDAGLPCGSIAVSARADGHRYDERDERILDALAERVSSTLHRLSLFEDVRSERHTLADILGSSSDGIFSVGPDLQIRSWNPAMARITGVPARDAVGRHCCSVFRPRDETGADRFGAACPGRSTEAVADLLVTIDTPGGGSRWVNCAYSPITEGGYVVVARDVTARKQIEDEKADFLATVSHELRTPLTPIKGFLQTLIRRDADFEPADRVHVYEVMLREERRLEHLVHQLLQATTFDHSEPLVVLEDLDWIALTTEVVARFQRDDPAREFPVDVGPAVGAVVGDTVLAQEILGNLLSNAVKYSPAGSPVSVRVVRRGREVVTTVVDRGPGIPRADRDRIFEKFTRLGDHLTRVQQGVGLGLYITRRSLESIGGRIWVDDAPGGGATFSFSLVARDEGARSHDAAARPATRRATA